MYENEPDADKCVYNSNREILLSGAAQHRPIFNVMFLGCDLRCTQINTVRCNTLHLITFGFILSLLQKVTQKHCLLYVRTWDCMTKMKKKTSYFQSGLTFILRNMQNIWILGVSNEKTILNIILSRVSFIYTEAHMKSAKSMYQG